MRIVSPEGTPRRRSTDTGEPTNRELLDQMDEQGRQLTAIATSQTQLAGRFDTHLIESATDHSKLEAVGKKIETFDQFMSDMRGAWKGLKTAIYLVGALVTVLAALNLLVEFARKVQP